MQRSIYFLFILGLLVAGSFFFLQARSPEETQIKSSDGAVLVIGEVLESQPISINEHPMVPAEDILSSAYEILPVGVQLSTSVNVYFDVRQHDDQESIVVYQLVETLDIWRPREAVLQDGILSFETDSLGWFVLGRRQTVQTPIFASTLDEILDFAPDGVVGYNVLLAFRSEAMHDTLLKTSVFEGGCGGSFQKGASTEFSRIEKPMRVLVNDVETNVTFIFIAEWQIGEGCSVENVLNPSTQL